MEPIPQLSDWYHRLSRAEREVLEAYAQYHSYQAVANALGKSVGVVDQQLLSARRKMGAVSTAEAMFMLAERRATSRVADPAVLHAPVAASAKRTASNLDLRKAFFACSLTAKSWLQRVKFIPALGTIAVGSLGVLVGMALKVKASVVAVQPTAPSPSAYDFASQIELFDKEFGGDPDNRARRRAELIGKLCERLWEDKWGPLEDEDATRVLPGVAVDIVNSFDWACKNDKDLAVKIIADGHRLFKVTGGPLAIWPQMINRALRLQGVKRSLEFGRLECGFVFTLVYKSRSTPNLLRLGLRKAQDAREVFRSLHKEADEANAIRHMGMCCAALGNINEAKVLYGQALSIYRLLQDQGGTAQSLLSIAQNAHAETSDGFARQGALLLNAIRASRETRSTEMLGEAWDEMTICKQIPRSAAGTLAGLRQEERRRADASDRSHDRRTGLAAMVDCLGIDVTLREPTALAADLERTIQFMQGVPVRLKNYEELRGFYNSLCERLARPVARSLEGVGPGSPVHFRSGERLSESEMIIVAREMYL